MKDTKNITQSKLQWQKYDTKNLNIFFILHSLADKHLETIKTKEEIAIKKLEDYLEVKNIAKINLYLYPSLTIKKKELGGKSQMYARYEGRRIAYVYNYRYPNVAAYHEETHILCFEWDKPSSYLENQYLISTASFYEGLAMHTQSKFFNKYFNRYSLNAKPPLGLTLHEAIKPDIVNNTAPQTQKILMYKGYCDNLKNGAQLGSVVDFLINTYGMAKFKKLFINLSESKTKEENILTFQKVYGQSIQDIDKQWRQFVLDSKD
jgi:hypothetical protein